MSTAGRAVTIGLLALMALAGLSSAVNELPGAETGLQLSVGFGQFAYGVFALFATIGAWRRRPWTTTLAVAYAVCLTYVVTVASFAFHDPTMAQEGTRSGMAAAFAGVALISGLLAWAAHRAAKPASTAVPPAA